MRTNETSQNVLPVDEATVQERQVTVKVLTIGTKQVTQSLYKQMVTKDVVDDETGELNGIPWGWVNLHIDCEVKRAHKHVVWEDNGQLKRACVHFSCENENYYYRDLNRELRCLAKVYVGLISIAGKGLNQSGETVYLTIKGQRVAIDVAGHIRGLWDYPEEIRRLKADLAEMLQSNGDEVPDRYKWRSRGSKKETIEYVQKQIEGIPDRIKYYNSNIEQQVIHPALDKAYGRNTDYSKYTSHEQIYQKMERLASEMTTISQNWKQSYKTIEDAGQLFIAVSGVWK